eukprot:4052894-Alexandrium_andersonii.AAC.1
MEGGLQPRRREFALSNPHSPIRSRNPVLVGACESPMRPGSLGGGGPCAGAGAPWRPGRLSSPPQPKGVGP